MLGAAMIVWASLGYILGSIPFGLILARFMGLGNLQKIGSGNIGATNVLRTGNKKAAFLTLVFDGGKGAIAVLIAQTFAGDAAGQIAGLAAMLGHCYPVWLSFKGGKGVATMLGVLFALNVQTGLVCCATWLVISVLVRISSLSALIATLSVAIWSVIFAQPSFIGLSIALSVLIFWRHRENIQRLLAGTEPQIGSKS
ncbi:MAG: acyl-phosphate glycerol 3-phosphate acyltransferase [Aestuariivita sp.]|nr:acyl-phosphate glycerol 3-phosphate acyltransferase [Aestuariivita sp.]